MKKTHVASGPGGTATIARGLAASLKGGETIALIGPLGAGKTTFTQAFAKALGVKERVTSPTFVYMHVHGLKRKAPKRLVHVDAYRGDAAALRGIGLDEYLGAPGTVCVIEWADRAEELLPKGTIRVRFAHGGGDKRRITITS